MKRAALVTLGIVVGYWQLRDWLDYWLPAIGALDSGYALVQIAALCIFASIAFGSVVSLAYRALNWIFE